MSKNKLLINFWIIISVLLMVSSVVATEWHVSPTGTSGGTGTQASPFALQYALNGAGGKVKAGDTIWLHGGTYKNYYTSTLNGAIGNPIRVRQALGERAILEGPQVNIPVVNGQDTTFEYPTLTLLSSYVWYQGFELTTEANLRVSSVSGGDTTYPRDMGMGPGFSNGRGSYPGNKLINLVVHDERGSGLQDNTMPSTADTELYGSLIYNAGWHSNEDHGHGHCIYGQNPSGTQYYTDNICWGGFSADFHLWGGGTAPIQNMIVTGNVVFEAGKTEDQSYADYNLIIGDSGGIRNINVKNNMLYFSDSGGSNAHMGYGGGGGQNILFQNNYIFGGSVDFDGSFPGLQAGGNEVHVADITGVTLGALGTGDTNMQKPAANKIFVRPTDPRFLDQYEPKLANIIIFNWQNLNTVQVPIAGVQLNAGDQYVLRNSENYFDDIISGTYSGGGYISVPMTGHNNVAMAKGWPKQMASTFPEFGVFILMKPSGASPPQIICTQETANPSNICQICNSAGSGYQAKCTAPQTCNTATGTCTNNQACTPGTANPSNKCQICNSAGSGYQAKCTATQTCNTATGTCENNNPATYCTPGTTQASTTCKVCNTQGTAYAPDSTKCTVAGQTCNTAGTCVSQSATCQDSDNGQNYNVAGTTRYSADGNAYCVFSDQCFGKVVREYYCVNGVIKYIYASCASGCSNGACSGSASCTPGTAQAGNLCSICNTAGTGYQAKCPTTQTCNTQTGTCTNNQACTPGSANPSNKCQICNTQGTAYTPKCVSPQTCNTATGTCENNNPATYCTPGSAQTGTACNVCNSAGTEYVPDSSKCSSTQTCSSGTCITINNPTGNVYYVATTGSDSNTGTSALPFKTIAKGLSMAQAGDIVHLKAGIYYEKVTFPRSGQAGKYITLEGEGQTATIIDGGDAVTWTPSSLGTGVYQSSSPNYFAPAASWNGKTLTVLASGLGENNPLSDSQVQTYLTRPSSDTTWTGIEALYAKIGSTIYFRSKNNENPGQDVRVAPDGSNTVYIDKDYIIIRNLGMRTAFAVLQLGTEGGGGANHCIIENTKISAAGEMNILISGGSSYNIIRNNNVTLDYIYPDFGHPWRSTIDGRIWSLWKGSSTGDRVAIELARHGAYNEIAYNHVYRVFDGLNEVSGGGYTKWHDNLVEYVADDAIDVAPSNPTEFYNNLVIEGGNNCLDIDYSSGEAGTLYFYNNKCYFLQTTNTGPCVYFKYIPSSSTKLWLYHNSFSCSQLSVAERANNGAAGSNVMWINNIFSSNGFAEYLDAEGYFDYNWIGGTSDSLSGQSMIGPNNKIVGNQLMWTLTNPTWIPSGQALQTGLDLSKSFVFNGQTYPALPGMNPGYFTGAKPNMGAVQ